MTDETNQLLREIRDLLIEQRDKYQQYLDESRHIATMNAQSYKEHSEASKRSYEEQFALHRREAFRRTVWWSVWAAALVGMLIYSSQ